MFCSFRNAPTLKGLPADAAVFFEFLLFIVLTTNAAISLGYVVSALAKSVSVAMALGPLCLMPLIIFGGLLINIDSIPNYFKWLSVFSFIQYGYSVSYFYLLYTSLIR
jgi:ATP-binding cassette, subfamily G (WHITE), eye pigment precursor transporter